MIHIVIYRLDGIETIAVFSKLSFAERFSNEVNGKIYLEKIDRLVTRKELSPFCSLADETQAIEPIEVPSNVGIEKLIKEVGSGIFNSNRISSSLLK